MNWSKTKSIFIICFLLLDAFLIFEIYMRQQSDEMSRLNTGSGTQNSFRMQTSIPATPQNVTFLSGSRMDFSRERKNISSLISPGTGTVRQKISIDGSGKQLMSVFDSPINGKITDPVVQKGILTQVYRGQAYSYWKGGSGESDASFTQVYDNRPVFISKHSNIQMLTFTLRNHKVVSYRQSYFKFKQSNTVDIISADKAISNLGENTNLLDAQQPVIKTIELGYINLIGDSNTDSLVFIPAWHIVVQTRQTQREYFVNAMSGNVQTMN
ncbi:two-component system regulatory protein YycI [Sporolactobacillus vineae]|uniref:two-component system regulatory protein YycI n=1 Tax=Sporolactobacillus vineae TaxID=444463 RepID=UPI000287AD21|nr:two-component system regulatory protein YycI [Sporolactobacillus vineae]